MNLKEEIDRRLASNQVYYAHFVPEQDFPRIRKETTNDILKLVVKRINEYQEYCKDMENRVEDGNDKLAFILHQGCCIRIKEMLKE